MLIKNGIYFLKHVKSNQNTLPNMCNPMHYCTIFDFLISNGLQCVSNLPSTDYITNTAAKKYIWWYKCDILNDMYCDSGETYVDHLKIYNG